MTTQTMPPILLPPPDFSAKLKPETRAWGVQMEAHAPMEPAFPIQEAGDEGVLHEQAQVQAEGEVAPQARRISLDMGRVKDITWEVTKALALVALGVGATTAYQRVHDRRALVTTPATEEMPTEKLFAKADMGDTAAMYWLGIRATNSRDPQGAFKNFLKAAEGGHVKAMTEVGLCYRDGIGVERDAVKSVHWLKEAAAVGNAQALNELGVAFYTGKGTPLDKYEAARCFFKAADQGVLESMSNVGIMLWNSDGIPQDRQQALRWLQKASEHGFPHAQQILGSAMLTDGLPEGSASAGFAWLRKSAEQGDVLAMLLVGDACMTGRGLEAPDPAQGLEWWVQAAQFRSADAVKRLMSLELVDPRATPAIQAKQLKAVQDEAAKGETIALARVGLAHIKIGKVTEAYQAWAKAAVTHDDPIAWGLLEAFKPLLSGHEGDLKDQVDALQYSTRAQKLPEAPRPQTPESLMVPVKVAAFQIDRTSGMQSKAITLVQNPAKKSVGPVTFTFKAVDAHGVILDTHTETSSPLQPGEKEQMSFFVDSQTSKVIISNMKVL